MTLSALIRKNESLNVANANPANSANDEQLGSDPLARLTALALANSELSKSDQAAIRQWIAHIGESDTATIAETLERCASDPATLRYFLMRSAELPEALPAHDGAICSQCRHWRCDTVGDGFGLGECLLNVNRRALPWPNQTACNMFKTAEKFQGTP